MRAPWRRWTKADDRHLMRAYDGKRTAGQLARKLHRSPYAVVQRAKFLRRRGAFEKAWEQNRDGTLPKHIPKRDPAVWCQRCDEPYGFGTDGFGFTVEWCHCGLRYVPRKGLAA